jgi:hypothetical protein
MTDTTQSDVFFGEQFPLAPIDDHLIHQTPDPVRVAFTTDPRFFERHWNVFHDQTGDLLIVTGGTFYPNQDAAEAYAIVTYRGIQRSVRAFRKLGADREAMHIGPIKPTILAGLRHWRHVLDENEWGISYDLEWHDTHRQVYRSAYSSLTHGSPPGGQRHVTSGFESFGEVEGWAMIDGTRVELTRATGRGTRDRHWGIGRGVGGPRFQPDGKVPKAGWIGGNWIAFSQFAIWGAIVLYRLGDARPGHGKVIKTDRRLRFEEETHIFVEAVIDYTLDSGDVKRVHFERLGNQTAYMKCGLYGGTPDGTRFQGEAVGEPFVEGDCYDLGNPANRTMLRGLAEHHCRITCDGEVTTGILQPLEPDAYEACLRGDKGWAFL